MYYILRLGDKILPVFTFLAIIILRSLELLQHFADIRRSLFLDFLLLIFYQLRHNCRYSYTAIADSRQQILVTVDIKAQADRIKPFITNKALWLIAQLLCLLYQKFMTAENIFLTLCFLKPATNLTACFSSRYDIQPVTARAIIIFICYNGN